MTKCPAFWRKVKEFKDKNDFDGFCQWCGSKSYTQLRRDWNTAETFGIIAEKSGKPFEEICSFAQLTENALTPIIQQRNDLPSGQKGARITVPNPIQEKAIELIMPKLLQGLPISRKDTEDALAVAQGKKTTIPSIPLNGAEVQKMSIKEVGDLLDLRLNGLKSVVKDFAVHIEKPCDKCPLETHCSNLIVQLQTMLPECVWRNCLHVASR